MERTFIQTSEFEDAWGKLGLADEELRQTWWNTSLLC